MILIDDYVLQKHGLTKEEVSYLLFLYYKEDTDKILHPLKYRGLIQSPHPPNKDLTIITPHGMKYLENIALSSEVKINPKLKKPTKLAEELKEIYPKGKKPGTNYYWTDGVPLIERRLQLFYKKYGTDYTNEQIIEATKKYIEGFNGFYTYMKLLKYFIFKESRNANGEVEGTSDLVNYIENADDADMLGNDWMNELK